MMSVDDLDRLIVQYPRTIGIKMVEACRTLAVNKRSIGAGMRVGKVYRDMKCVGRAKGMCKNTRRYHDKLTNP